MMKTKFVPCYDGEKSPSRLDLENNFETKKRIELCEEPLGTIIQFRGVHPDSEYICKIVDSENEKKIKVWFKGRYPSAIVSIDKIISFSGPITNWIEEKGVIEIGKSYVLPHFYYEYNTPQGTKLIIDPQLRMEQYTALFVKKP